jgi:hypothetical protein
MRAAAAPPSVTEVFVCTSATPRVRARRPSPPASAAQAAATRPIPAGDMSARRRTASGRTWTSAPTARRSPTSGPSLGEDDERDVAVGVEPAASSVSWRSAP